jgi:polyisoprenoid-binding protein YceI
MRATILALALTGTAATAWAAEESYTFDPYHTYPNFKVSHLGFSTMYGQFTRTTGKMTLDPGKSGSVEITIDASSIDTGMQDKGPMPRSRDDHLRSNDFLNVVEFPEITYKSTRVIFDGDEKATIEGDLTLLGVTKPVTLEVDRIKCGTHPFNKKEMCGFNATGTLKRSDFGMTYGLPAIGDELTLMIEAEATKD